MKKTFTKLTLALALTGSALAFAVPSEAKPKCPKEGIFCPAYYDPVLCSNGQVYSNACFANVACATGCQPYTPPA
jgi:hypothetical protein